jgi:hypothetical protein
MGESGQYGQKNTPKAGVSPLGFRQEDHTTSAKDVNLFFRRILSWSMPIQSTGIDQNNIFAIAC